MNISELKEWATRKNVDARTKEMFWRNFENYIKESPEEIKDIDKNFKIENLKAEVKNVSLKLGNWPCCNYNHVIVCLSIYYNGDQIGSYELLFDLEGNIDDDYFVIF